jgi:hypothetical protein
VSPIACSWLAARAWSEADHGPDEAVRGHVGKGAARHPATVAEDRHALAELEHLLEAVRDEEHGGTRGPEALDDTEQPRHLDSRESGRRLVHDDHSRVERERLADLDDLLLRNREPSRDAAGIEPNAESAEDLFDVPAHRAPVDPAPRRQRLPADVNVLLDCQVREEERLLQ